jgi:hypothetical protein
MAMTKECTICKHIGKRNNDLGDLEAGFLFNDIEHPATIQIRLCRSHSVELFKIGQKKFLLEYHHILHGLVNSDEMEFIKLLDRVVKKNLDAIY